MADLYRKSVLEKLASPEQMDVPQKVAQPMSRLILVGLAILVLVGGGWIFFGSIPQSIEAEGLVVSPSVGIYSLYAGTAGTVKDVYVSEGGKVYRGDVVMRIETGDGRLESVCADQTGYVVSIGRYVDETVSDAGEEIMTLRPEVNGADRVVVCYVPDSSRSDIQLGMELNVMLYQYDSQSYGHMRARVINVDPRRTNEESQSRVIGRDNNMKTLFAPEKGGVMAVTCELLADADTRSGFYWSAERGAQNATVDLYSTCRVQIELDSRKPIGMFLDMVRNEWFN